MKFSCRKFGWLMLVMCGLSVDALRAQEFTSVAFGWDPNPESDLKEYRLHIGTSSGNYDITIPVGLVTTFRVVDLPAGTNYYFALTAVNKAGVESDPSREVTFSPASDGGRLSLVKATNSFQVVLDGTPDSPYTIQASPNLRDWTTIATNLADSSGVMSITMNRAQQGRAQFFRALKGQ